MAARGTKRSSTIPAGSPKKRKPSSGKEHVEIAAALRKARCPNETTSMMLASMVATSLGVYKDVRHAHQEEVAENIGQALNEHVVKMQAAIDESKAKVDDAGLEKTRRADALTAADAEVAKAQAAVGVAQASVASAKAAVSSAEKELHGVEDVQRNGDKDYNALVRKRTKVVEAQEAMNAARESKIDARALKIVKSVGTEFSVDKTMLMSLPMAVNKDPAKRSSFDNVILDQVGEALKKIVAEQSANVDVAEPAKAERQGAVDSATQVRDVAQAGLASREKELSEAKAAQAEAKKAQADAKKAVNNYVADMKAIMDGYDVAKEDIIAFKEGPLALFVELKERVTPPPEPEVSPPAEEGSVQEVQVVPDVVVADAV